MPAAGDDDIEVRVILTDELSRPAENVIRQEERMGEAARNAATDTDRLTDAQRDNTEETTRSIRSIRAQTQERDEQGRFITRITETTETETTTLRRNTRERDKSTKSLFKNIKGWFSFGKILNLFKYAIMLDGIAKAMAGVAALGGIALGAIGGLAPLTGVLLPLPALLAGAGLAMVTFKMGFSGIADAISAYDPNDLTKFNEAIKEMGPNGKDAALGLAQVKEQFKPIQKMVQENLLAGFGDTVRNLGDTYFPVMEGAMDDVSKRMKGVLDIATGFLQLPSTVSEVGGAMGTLSLIAEQMGHTFNGALRGTLHMFSAVAPVAIDMAEMIAQGVNSLADSVFQNEDKIRTFAANGLTMFQQMMGTIVDLFIGFKNIASAGSSLFDGMGGRFGDMADRFKDWTRSVEGQQKIKDFFAQLRPILEALINLAKDVAKAIGGIAGDNMGTLVPMIDKFREMVPNIKSIVDSAAGAAPAFLAIADAVLQMVGDTEALTPTTAILETATPIIEGLATVITNLPGPLQTAIGYIVTFSLLLKTAAFQAMWGYIAATRIGTIAIANFNMALALSKIALMQFLAAQWAAFIASPIGIFIAIVLVLVGIFVLLWYKCEAFRNLIKAIGQWFVDVWNNQINPLVQKTWQWMQVAWDKVLDIVRGAIDWIVDFFTSAWDKVKTVVGVIVTIFKVYFNIIKTVVMTYINIVVTIFKTAFNIVKTVVMTVVNAILGFWQAGVSAWKAVLAPFIAFFGPIFSGVVDIIKGAIGLVVAIFKLGWNIIRLIVNIGILAITTMFSWLWEKIKPIIDWIVMAWNVAWTLIKAAFGFAVAWIMDKVNTVKVWFQAAWTFVSTMFGIAVDWIMTKWNTFTGAIGVALAIIGAWFSEKWAWISGVVAGVIEAVKMKIGEIVGAVSNALAPIVGWFQEKWTIVSTAVSTAIEVVKNAIGSVIDKVGSVLGSVQSKFESVFGRIRDFVMGIIDRIKGAISGITDIVSNISSGIASIADKLPGLAKGGVVTPGMTAMVGEVGPEAFVSNTGKVSAIGTHGPEIRKFDNGGYVVPNHVLGGKSDPSVPGNVMNRLTNAMAAGNDHAHDTGGYHQNKSRAQSNDNYGEKGGDGDYYDFSGAVFGGSVTKAEVKSAVKESLREIDRNTKERK